MGMDVVLAVLAAGGAVAIIVACAFLWFVRI
jgi:hypothetical protein